MDASAGPPMGTDAARRPPRFAHDNLLHNPGISPQRRAHFDALHPIVITRRPNRCCPNAIRHTISRRRLRYYLQAARALCAAVGANWDYALKE